MSPPEPSAAPTAPALTEAGLARYPHFARLRDACRGLPALPTAVVRPDDANSLGGAIAAWRAGLIQPVLVGARDRIAAAALGLGEDISAFESVDAADEADAASRAVEMVHLGRVRSIMKGNLHTDVLLRALFRRDSGLRTERRLSHVFVTDTPGFDRPLFVTDSALNIAPDLEAKLDIVRNAIDLARACGVEPPRVAIVSAVETVNPKMASTIDAALIAKMADRGQIPGALIDGPLAMDNAVNADAARTKGIRSEVAGRADVLLMPTIECGNVLVKALTFVAGGESAGIVLGGTVPVMLTSRADSPTARLVSCALALLLDDWRRHGRSRLGSA